MITPLFVPEALLNLNQTALSPALQLSVPPPILLMFKIWVGELAAPCVAAKESFVGLARMAAGGTGGDVTGGGDEGVLDGGGVGKDPAGT